MRIIPVFMILVLSLYACRTAKPASSLKLAEDGYYYYQQVSPPLSMQLLGDYKFQPLKTKYYRDIDKPFLSYALCKLDEQKPYLLYAAHTVVQPYYSTLCLQYKGCVLDSTTISFLKKELKLNAHTSFARPEILKLNSREVYKVKYQVTNSNTGISSSHTEYLFKSENYVYRLLFWTTNADDTVISVEAENIIRQIKAGEDNT